VFAVDLHCGLEAHGLDVRTVALAPGRVGGLDLEVLGRGRRDPRILRALRAAISTVDVVVGHGSTTLPACALAGIATGVPFVYRQISDSLFWADTVARRVRVRAALTRATRVVALWDGAARTLVRHFGVARDGIDRIPNAVPRDRFPFAGHDGRVKARRALGIDEGTPVIAYVGALVEEKGVDMAVDLAVARPDLTLLVAGDGRERAALRRRAASGGDRVRFLGNLSDPRPVYAAADVVVLPSRGGDSMPATLIEAGLTGRAAVATAVAAIPEMVVDGRTGTVVVPGDGAAFSAAVGRLLDDADLRRSFELEAREHCVRTYAIDAVAASWVTSLQDAVDATRPSGTRIKHGERRQKVAAP